MEFAFTKVPNIFFDNTRDLTNAQFRILAMIIRKLTGWNKEKDQISHGQLMKTTGLSISGIKKVMKKLVGKGYLKRSPYKVRRDYVQNALLT